MTNEEKPEPPPDGIMLNIGIDEESLDGRVIIQVCHGGTFNTAAVSPDLARDLAKTLMGLADSVDEILRDLRMKKIAGDGREIIVPNRETQRHMKRRAKDLLN